MPTLTLTINGDTVECEGDETSIPALDAEIERAAAILGVSTERLARDFVLTFRGFNHNDPTERERQTKVLLFYALSLDLKEPHPGKVRDYAPALDFKIDITVRDTRVHASVSATAGYPRA